MKRWLHLKAYHLLIYFKKILGTEFADENDASSPPVLETQEREAQIMKGNGTTTFSKAVGGKAKAKVEE